MGDVFIEFMVKKQKRVTDLLLIALIIVGTIVLSFVLFILSLNIELLSSFGLLLVAGVIYLAYRLISGMNVEFEYTITNGEMDIDKITSRRKRKRLISVNCRNFEEFGKYNAESHASRQYGERIFACDNPENPEIWFAVTNHPSKGKLLLVFNASDRMLSAFKSFVPRQIIVSLRQQGITL